MSPFLAELGRGEKGGYVSVKGSWIAALRPRDQKKNQGSSNRKKTKKVKGVNEKNKIKRILLQYRDKHYLYFFPRLALLLLLLLLLLLEISSSDPRMWKSVPAAGRPPPPY